LPLVGLSSLDFMTSQALFARSGDRFIPGESARGPWKADSLNGRSIMGLLGAVIEARHQPSGFLPARLTVDMYRLPDFSPIKIVSRVIRDGNRIKVIEAELFSGSVSAARASCQMLKQTQNPEGSPWSPPHWNVPAPEDLDPGEANGRPWEVRIINGGVAQDGQARAWSRDTAQVVEGMALTPYARLALLADSASPYANSSSAGLSFINSDVTLYAHRLPESEWVGLEVVNHQATAGIAIAECRLYDARGAVATASVAALAQRKLDLG
jgi:hypothetical protein